MFDFAVAEGLRPVLEAPITVDIAGIIFGLENEDSLLIDGNAVDLDEFRASEMFDRGA